MFECMAHSLLNAEAETLPVNIISVRKVSTPHSVWWECVRVLKVNTSSVRGTRCVCTDTKLVEMSVGVSFPLFFMAHVVERMVM